MISLLRTVFALAEDWSPDWMAGREGECTPEDAEDCKHDRADADAVEAKPLERRAVFPVVDLEDKAATVKYPNGKRKRGRYRRVDLRARTVVIGLHQAGVERGESRWEKTAHRVTCHRAIGPRGNRYRVHPLTERLVCTNALDRKPWHCIGIETLGNFEGVEGTGNWYKPDTFGHGVLGKAQAEALYQEIAGIMVEVEALGGRVVALAPHRVAGRDRKGKPNRQICCGSAVWRIGERAALDFGLRIPGPAQTFGGLPIDPRWYGDAYPKLQAAGLVGM